MNSIYTELNPQNIKHLNSIGNAFYSFIAINKAPHCAVLFLIFLSCYCAETPYLPFPLWEDVVNGTFLMSVSFDLTLLFLMGSRDLWREYGVGLGQFSHNTQ